MKKFIVIFMLVSPAAFAAINGAYTKVLGAEDCPQEIQATMDFRASTVVLNLYDEQDSELNYFVENKKIKNDKRVFTSSVSADKIEIVEYEKRFLGLKKELIYKMLLEEIDQNNLSLSTLLSGTERDQETQCQYRRL
jgi:hypothetical protein